METLLSWTKKIDDMHLYTVSSDGRTLCGKPMLGNNYAKAYTERTPCKECTKIAKRNKTWKITHEPTLDIGMVIVIEKGNVTCVSTEGEIDYRVINFDTRTITEYTPDSINTDPDSFTEEILSESHKRDLEVHEHKG